MKASFSRAALLEAFTAASGVAPSRSPKPIIQNVKLDVTEDGPSLQATDLEVGIRHSVMGVKVERPGSAILPTAQVGSILRACNDDELSIEADDKGIVIRGMYSEFKLPGEDASLFPDVPDFAATSYHVVAAADLKRLIRRTVFATSAETSRYALGGCLVELGSASCALIGTDGRRLAKAEAKAESEGDTGGTLPRPVIPAKALKLIDKVIDDRDPPVHLSFDATSALIRTATAVIYTRLVEGRFPRYQDAIPGTPSIKIPLEAGAFLAAVEQARIVASEESRAVDFRFGCGMLRLKASSSDRGASTVDLPIDHDGNPITIALDPAYLTDMLKTLGPAESLSCEIVDDKTGIAFRADGFTYICMPLTRDKE